MKREGPPRLRIERPPAAYREELRAFLRWLAREAPPTRSVRLRFVNAPVAPATSEAPSGVAGGGALLYVAAAQPGASFLAIAQAAAEVYASAVRFAPDRRAFAKRVLQRYLREKERALPR